MANLMKVTPYYFEPKYIETDFTDRFLRASLYKPGFDVIQNYKISGNLTDPLETIPEELQIFPGVKIVHLYTLTLEKILDWHQDLMKLDAMSSGKYTALVTGKGVLEIKDNNSDYIEKFEFNECNRWVKFAHLNYHRFIPHMKTTMVLANTITDEEAKNFSIKYYEGTTSNYTYPALENIEERQKLNTILKDYEERNK